MDGVKVSSLPGHVSLLTLTGNGQHRFNQSYLAAINVALDEVEKDTNARALVTTNEGKFFSNGLDLTEASKDARMFGLIIEDFQKLLKRLLLFPIPSYAAICGHAAAGGCMLALAHDYRAMSADKGYIFLNEVDIKLPLSPGMNALIRSKIPGSSFYKAVLTGHKFSAMEAVEHGFMDVAQPNPTSTLEAALKGARTLAAKNFDRVTYRALKAEMFKSQIEDLEKGGVTVSVESLRRILARL